MLPARVFKYGRNVLYKSKPGLTQDALVYLSYSQVLPLGAARSLHQLALLLKHLNNLTFNRKWLAGGYYPTHECARAVSVSDQGSIVTTLHFYE